MGAEERRHDRHRPLDAEPARGAQQAGLGVEIEPVTGLDLDRGHALGDQPVEARGGARDELVLARRPRRLDGRDDAAAGRGDLAVARAGQAQLELVRAVAAEDEVGMAVDQAGGDPTAVASDALGGVGVRRQVALRADKGDAPAAGPDRAALDDPEARPARMERGQARIEPQPIEPHSSSSAGLSRSGRC